MSFQCFKVFIFLFIMSIIPAFGENVYFDGKDLPLQHGKIGVSVVSLGNDKTLASVAKVIGDGLDFTDQFKSRVNKSRSQYSRRELSKLFRQDIAYCVFLKKLKSDGKKEIKFKVILKDTDTGNTEFEETFSCNENNFVPAGNLICSKLSLDLTGIEGIFLNKLAFCEQLAPYKKVIYVSDYSCKFKKLVASKNVNSVPCWHSTLPILFYSKLNKVSNELMALNLRTNKRKVVCSFKGLNSQPSVSEDGSKVALCLGKTGNSELYLYDQSESKKQKKRVFKQLTRNKGNNSSPCYLPNGDLVFCSDFELGTPHIYYFDMGKKSLRRLTKGSYSAGPSYSKATNSIVYTKIVDRVFQLFTLDLTDIKQGRCREKQLTFGEGDKHDPCWSDCGNYVYFAYRCPDDKGKRILQVAVFNIASKNTRVLTSGDRQKSFPVLDAKSDSKFFI